MQTYPTGYAESHRVAEKIFREILPRHGMAVREEQIALCHEVLDTLYNKEISLCEAGVGTGKTLAYLVACILWQMNRPERMKLPIVISTSSVALQDAILTEYLPDLSAILLGEGIIREPITAVVRKGKERFVCDARLAERTALVHPKRTREKNSLRIAENILDMDHIPELSHYDRCRICVPQSCPRDCFMRLDCRYQQYLRDSMKPDIQICNHNYLLADASHRLEDRPLLLRSYQALVVDEAHKLPDAARQMYTETLSEADMNDLCLQLQQAHYLHLAQRLRSAFLAFSILANADYCGTAEYPQIITVGQLEAVEQIRKSKTVTYSATLKPFRKDMQCGCCGARLYWHPKSKQWVCRECGMWSKPTQAEETFNSIVEKLRWLQQNSELIHPPAGKANVQSMEIVLLDREIGQVLLDAEPDADALITKILHRAELEYEFCSAGDADPATMQIRKDCAEYKPTDGFPHTFYKEVVSKVILYRDTHIEFKLQNGQIV